MRRKGFTLIELLVVIAIIAILAAILFPVFGNVRKKVRETQCMTQMHDVYIALKVYKEDNNKYPAALFGFAEDTSGNLYTGGTAAISAHCAINRCSPNKTISKTTQNSSVPSPKIRVRRM